MERWKQVQGKITGQIAEWFLLPLGEGKDEGAFELETLTSVLSQETVSQCHPEAIAEGSRFSKWQKTVDSSRCSE